MRERDVFYSKQPEPTRSCLLALRKIILDHDRNLTEAWKYSMPFFCLRDKMFCYLWTSKQTGWPYLGMVDGKKLTHPKLIAEKRSRMKIFLVNPTRDIPVKTINEILKAAIRLRAGQLPIK